MSRHGANEESTTIAPVEGSHMSALLKRHTYHELTDEPSLRVHFWRGASGKRYVHTVHSLLSCPRLPRATYVLVREEDDGQRSALRIGRTSSDCGSINLAEVRRRGAQLGATEVHVHLIADDECGRMLVEMDLQAGHFRALQCEPAPALVH